MSGKDEFGEKREGEESERECDIRERTCDCDFTALLPREVGIENDDCARSCEDEACEGSENCEEKHERFSPELRPRAVALCDDFVCELVQNETETDGECRDEESENKLGSKSSFKYNGESEGDCEPSNEQVLYFSLTRP